VRTILSGPILVDKTRAREHLLSLMDQGMSIKRVCAITGQGHGVLSSIIYGRAYDGRPSKRIHRRTERRVLAVELDLADGAKVPPFEAHLIVAELVRRGWRKHQIGKRVHDNPDASSLQIARQKGGQVYARTIRLLRELLYEPVPVTVSRFGNPQPTMPESEWKDVIPFTAGIPDLNKHRRRHLWRIEMRKGLIEALEMARERNRQSSLELPDVPIIIKRDARGRLVNRGYA
jgi:hypothetical protein